MRDAIPLGRIAGFPVKVHWSVIVILWLFTWSLASTLPATVKGYSHLAYWLAGAFGALVLLACGAFGLASVAGAMFLSQERRE